MAQYDIGITEPSLAQLMRMHERLTSIYSILLEMNEVLQESRYSPETADLFEIVMLYKSGFGSNWIPQRKERQYIRVYALVATAILATTPIAPPTTITIPAITNLANTLWLPFDFPDMSSFILDSTATANAMPIYVRYTMQPSK